MQIMSNVSKKEVYFKCYKNEIDTLMVAMEVVEPEVRKSMEDNIVNVIDGLIAKGYVEKRHSEEDYEEEVK